MIQVNDNFIKLPGNYLFSSIAKKVNAFKSAHPEAALIRLGIGDVTRPLPPASIKAMHRAVDELADAGTFHGYGPEQGYDFLIQAILEHDYRSRGVELRPTEIFVSDGAKSDTGNLGDILGTGNKVAITDPVYPVYIDSNVMAGRAGELQANGQWNRLTYLPCTAENHLSLLSPGAGRHDLFVLSEQSYGNNADESRIAEVGRLCFRAQSVDII